MGDVYAFLIRNPLDHLRRVPLFHRPSGHLVDQADDTHHAIALANWYNLPPSQIRRPPGGTPVDDRRPPMPGRR